MQKSKSNRLGVGVVITNIVVAILVNGCARNGATVARAPVEQEVVWESLGGPEGGSVTSIVRDRTGRMFAAFYNGVHFRDPSDTAWTRIIKGGHAGQDAHLVVDSSGRVLSANDWQVLGLDSSRLAWQLIGYRHDAKELAIAPDGSLLEAHEFWVSRLSHHDSTWTHLGGFEMHRLRTLCAAPNGVVYAGSGYLGLFRWTPGDTGFVASGLSGRNVIDIIASRDGQIYAATDSGVFRQSSVDRWEPLPPFGRGRPRTLALDNDGSLLVGTDSPGRLLELSPATHAWREHTDGIIASVVSAIFVDDDHVMYCGTNVGMYRRDAASRVWQPFSNGAQSTWPVHLENVPRLGILTASWASGIHVLLPGDARWRERNEGLPSMHVDLLVIDSAGRTHALIDGHGFYVRTTSDSIWRRGSGQIDIKRSRAFALATAADGSIYAATAMLHRLAAGDSVWRPTRRPTPEEERLQDTRIVRMGNDGYVYAMQTMPIGSRGELLVVRQHPGADRWDSVATVGDVGGLGSIDMAVSRNGTIYVATINRLIRRDGETGNASVLIERDNYFSSVLRFDNNGNLFIGLKDLYTIAAGDDQVRHIRLPEELDDVSSITFDASGNPLVGMGYNSGVWRARIVRREAGH